MKISVIGLGIYSIDISSLLEKNDNKICIWTESQEKYEEYKKTKKVSSIIDAPLSKNIKISTNMEEVLKDTQIIYIITASKYVDSVVQKIKPFYHKNAPVCIASKGIEETSECFLSDIVRKNLKTKHIAVISGPTFAVDILNNEPVALALGSISKKARNLVLKTLSSNTLKLRPTNDIIGIQICGAIKNIIAIASGILKGLSYNDSTQAFLINEAMHDIKDIIYYFGGKPKTVLSFAGIGDLMLTCTSTKSRNFSFGYVIGSTNNVQKINDYLAHNTVEGYYTLDTVYRILNRKNVQIDLITIIYNIVYNGENPNTLVSFLITKK